MATGLTPKSSGALSSQMRFDEGSVLHMPQDNRQSDNPSEEDDSDRFNRQISDEQFRRQQERRKENKYLMETDQ